MPKYPMLWFVAFDDKEKLSSIEGQSIDDRYFTEDIYKLQQKGAPVRCDTPRVSTYPQKEKLINELNKMGYKYCEQSVLRKYR